MHDTWAARELPVLDATVSLLEESYMVTVSDIATRTKLEPAAVARALEALDPEYVDFRKTTTGGDPTFWYVLKVTPQARRVVGQWPTPDSFVTRLAEELSAAASQEEDAERKGLLSYAARLVGDTLREAAVRAAGQVLAPAIGTASPAPPAPPPARPAPAAAAPAQPAPAQPARPAPVRPASAQPAPARPDSDQPDAGRQDAGHQDASQPGPSWPPALAVVRSGPPADEPWAASGPDTGARPGPAEPDAAPAGPVTPA
ncbi:MAG TPA: hypothetical protein VFV41_08040 [Streptosporangiaceae bacterium]|nr:hypothetical protein [Streptosporangiaceae bacterium]